MKKHSCRGALVWRTGGKRTCEGLFKFAKRIQKGTKREPTLRRKCIQNGREEPKGNRRDGNCQKEVPGVVAMLGRGTLLATIFGQKSKQVSPISPKWSPKSEKWTVKPHAQIDVGTNIERLPNGIEHDAKMYAKINGFPNLKKGDFLSTICFSNRKHCSDHANMYHKSIENRCNIDARKRHTKSKEH